MLSLHLLQNCMVYINTLMIQQVFKRSRAHESNDPRGPPGAHPSNFQPYQPLWNFSAGYGQPNSHRICCQGGGMIGNRCTPEKFNTFFFNIK